MSETQDNAFLSRQQPESFPLNSPFSTLKFLGQMVQTSICIDASVIFLNYGGLLMLRIYFISIKMGL